MTDYIRVTPPVAALLAARNATSQYKKLVPMPLTAGLPALNADVLDDCESGQTWELFANDMGNSKAARAALTRTTIPPSSFASAVGGL